jgi:hypothetical protein
MTFANCALVTGVSSTAGLETGSVKLYPETGPEAADDLNQGLQLLKFDNCFDLAKHLMEPGEQARATYITLPRRAGLNVLHREPDAPLPIQYLVCAEGVVPELLRSCYNLGRSAPAPVPVPAQAEAKQEHEAKREREFKDEDQPQPVPFSASNSSGRELRVCAACQSTEREVGLSYIHKCPRNERGTLTLESPLACFCDDCAASHFRIFASTCPNCRAELGGSTYLNARGEEVRIPHHRQSCPPENVVQVQYGPADDAMSEAQERAYFQQLDRQNRARRRQEQEQAQAQERRRRAVRRRREQRIEVERQEQEASLLRHNPHLYRPPDESPSPEPQRRRLEPVVIEESEDELAAQQEQHQNESSDSTVPFNE